MDRVFRPLRLTARLGVCLAAAAALVAGGAAAAVAAPGESPPPGVSGPVTGGAHGYPFGSLAHRPSPVDLGAAGYTEAEYLLHGTARSYEPTAPLGGDGRWSVRPAATAPYTTRMLVERPADPRRFNGTVIVEWLNVSAAAEIPPDLVYAHRELLRDGFAWVGVSAQRLGIAGSPFSLTAWDPARYGTLSHPGDGFSYDIFTQAGAALRHPSGVPPLGGLRVRHLIADGESQSASRMATYVNAIAPRTHAYDGYLIHSRGAGAAPVAQAPQPPAEPPATVLLRHDQRAPVLQFQTETELTTLGYPPARQPDTARLRTWEVAGTAHIDKTALGEITAMQRRDLPDYPTPVCDRTPNDGQERYVMNAAVRDLNRWVSGGPAPRRAPRVDLTSGGAVVRDANGNAVGGIRTPAVDAPLTTLTGDGNTPATGFCVLFGTTTPLPPATIARLYPGGRTAYLTRVAQAAAAGVRRGYLDARDVPRMLRESAAAWPS